MSLFKTLSKIDVSKHIEKKNNLSYLSWSWAWQSINEHVDNVKMTVYKNKDGLNYHHDMNTAWVEVGITADDIEHIEMLPVMDYRNKSIPLANLTSIDVNKAIQRCATKAIARHGLGLYIYSGEDLPSQEVTTDQVLALEQLIASTKSDRSAFMKAYRINKLEDITPDAYQNAISILHKKEAKAS